MRKISNRAMRKISKKLLVVIFALSTYGFVIASENDNLKSGSDVLKDRVDEKLSQHTDHNIHYVVNNHLEHNVKKHRDSSRYKLILVNDKISSKYTTLNYMINKQLKYGPNSEGYNTEK